MKIAIIGGGASGCVLAGLLAEEGIEVSLFEQSSRLLRKVLATGNGRCNFTNDSISTEYYIGDQKLIGKVLGDFSAKKFFHRLGLAYHTLESGMVYPATMQAKSLVDRLEVWLKHLNVKIYYNKEITKLEKKDGHFFIDGKSFSICVLATGGSYGIEKKEFSLGYSLAKDMGHTLTGLSAGIVSLTSPDKELYLPLQGTKLLCKVSYKEKSFLDDLLFTNYGFSGIGILKLSNTLLMDGGDRFEIDLLPFWQEEDLKRDFQRLAKAFPSWSDVEILSGYLPEELARYILYRSKDLLSSIGLLKKMQVNVSGCRKKDHGQITCGGVNTQDIDDHLESKLTKGLFFTGEILDIQGECGGYNLHFAWASAHHVFQSIRRSSV